MSGGSLVATSTTSTYDVTNLEANVLNALSRDGKIAAIKFYRERTKVGLKEAKEAVEGIATRHGVAAKGSGCAGVLLLFVCPSLQ